MANQFKINQTVVNVGDRVVVHHFIKEGEKKKSQQFDGVVIAVKGRGSNKMFTVRKIASAGVGVERIWPVESPNIKEVEIKKRGKVRRAKLYYLRGRVGKRATKVKEKTEKKPVKTKKTDKKNDQKKTGKRSRSKDSSK